MITGGSVDCYCYCYWPVLLIIVGIVIIVTIIVIFIVLFIGVVIWCNYSSIDIMTVMTGAIITVFIVIYCVVLFLLLLIVTIYVLPITLTLLLCRQTSHSIDLRTIWFDLTHCAPFICYILTPFLFCLLTIYIYLYFDLTLCDTLLLLTLLTNILFYY